MDEYSTLSSVSFWFGFVLSIFFGFMWGAHIFIITALMFLIGAFCGVAFKNHEDEKKKRG